jgi:hypothetical protein
MDQQQPHQGFMPVHSKPLNLNNQNSNSQELFDSEGNVLLLY